MIYLIILSAIAILTLVGIKIKKIIEAPEPPTITTTTTQSMDCIITGSAAQTNLKTKAKK